MLRLFGWRIRQIYLEKYKGDIYGKYKELKKYAGKVDIACQKNGEDIVLDDVIENAINVIQIASFLKQYKDLDAERKKNVIETTLASMNENNTYDSSFLKCLEYCFGETD